MREPRLGGIHWAAVQSAISVLSEMERTAAAGSGGVLAAPLLDLSVSQPRAPLVADLANCMRPISVECFEFQVKNSYFFIIIFQRIHSGTFI